MTDTLEEIALRCGTDKATKHSYMPMYEELVGHRRDEPIRILEIGVNGTRRGASVKMWLEAFPRASVHGVDKQHPPSSLRNHPRYRHVTGDAYTEEIFRVLAMSRYDFIIDDGPHLVSTQAFAVERYSTLLTDGGVLVVEDVNLTKYPNVLDTFIRAADESGITRRVGLMDLRHLKSRFDDVMFIVEGLVSGTETGRDSAEGVKMQGSVEES